MDIKYKLIIELMLKVNLVKLLKWDCLLSKLLRNSCRIVFSNIQIQMHVSILLLARTESSRRLTRVELNSKCSARAHFDPLQGGKCSRLNNWSGIPQIIPLNHNLLLVSHGVIDRNYSSQERIDWNCQANKQLRQLTNEPAPAPRRRSPSPCSTAPARWPSASRPRPPRPSPSPQGPQPRRRRVLRAQGRMGSSGRWGLGGGGGGWGWRPRGTTWRARGGGGARTRVGGHGEEAAWRGRRLGGGNPKGKNGNA
jgi:hypothetical protein